jgi:hypothetical protein
MPSADAADAADAAWSAVLPVTTAILLASGILCLANLTLEVWKDYVPMLAAAFLISQALHATRVDMVAQVVRMRKNGPKFAWIRFGNMVTHMPGAWLPALAVLLAVFWLDLFIDRTVMFLVLIVTAMVMWALCNGVLWLWVHRPVSPDQRVRTHRDENIATTLLLVTMMISFLTILLTLVGRSIFDGILILFDLSTWSRQQGSALGPGARAAITNAGAALCERAGLLVDEQPAVDTPFAPIAKHLFQQLCNNDGSHSTDARLVLSSTMEVVKVEFPDLGPLLTPYIDLLRQCKVAAGSFQGELCEEEIDLGHLTTALKTSGLQIRELLEQRGLGEATAQAFNALGQGVASVGLSALNHLVVSLARLLQLVMGLVQQLLASLVFATFTFHMLAHDHDALRMVSSLSSYHLSLYHASAQRRGFLPRREPQTAAERAGDGDGDGDGAAAADAQGRHLDEEGDFVVRLRAAVHGAVSMTFVVAARDVFFLVMLFEVIGVPHGYPALLLVAVFTLFPLVPRLLVFFPWCLALAMDGSWVGRARALALVIFEALDVPEMLAPLADQTTSVMNDTIGSYIFSFSLILGVNRFGWSGVLFGPLLVLLIAIATTLFARSQRR